MIAIHIDDELDSLEVMQILLKTHCPQIELVASVTSVDQGLSVIKERVVDLVFLDIEMPGKNGFEFLDALQNQTFQVVMVTGYESYAIKAIKYAALDYLLKPLDAADLIKAVEKADRAKESATERLKHYRYLLAQEEEEYSSLMIASESGYRNIDMRDLVYMKSETGSYCLMYLANGTKEVVSKSLNHFEGLLPAKCFFRIHRSHLINLKKIKAYCSRTATVTLEGDVKLLVSTRRKSDFRKKMIV